MFITAQELLWCNIIFVRNEVCADVGDCVVLSTVKRDTNYARYHHKVASIRETTSLYIEWSQVTYNYTSDDLFTTEKVYNYFVDARTTNSVIPPARIMSEYTICIIAEMCAKDVGWWEIYCSRNIYLIQPHINPIKSDNNEFWNHFNLANGLKFNR